MAKILPSMTTSIVKSAREYLFIFHGPAYCSYSSVAHCPFHSIFMSVSPTEPILPVRARVHADSLTILWFEFCRNLPLLVMFFQGETYFREVSSSILYKATLYKVVQSSISVRVMYLWHRDVYGYAGLTAENE